MELVLRTPCLSFVNFWALRIPTVEYTWSWGGVLTYLRAQHHTDGERILSPSFGGSWTSAFTLGPLLFLVKVCAGESPLLDMCSTQLLHLPLKLIPPSAETIWPDSGFLRQLCSLWPSGRKTDLGAYMASWTSGSPHRQWKRAKLTMAYILLWERNRVWEDYEGCGVPRQETSLTLTLKGKHGDRAPGAELLCLWPLHFPEYSLPKGDSLDANSVVFV